MFYSATQTGAFATPASLPLPNAIVRPCSLNGPLPFQHPLSLQRALQLLILLCQVAPARSTLRSISELRSLRRPSRAACNRSSAVCGLSTAPRVARAACGRSSAVSSARGETKRRCAILHPVQRSLKPFSGPRLKLPRHLADLKADLAHSHRTHRCADHAHARWRGTPCKLLAKACMDEAETVGKPSTIVSVWNAVYGGAKRAGRCRGQIERFWRNP